MRTVKHTVAPTDGAIIKYSDAFRKLKDALLSRATIYTEITVLRIMETVEGIGNVL